MGNALNNLGLGEKEALPVKGTALPKKVEADIKKIADEEGKDLLDNMPQ